MNGYTINETLLWEKQRAYVLLSQSSQALKGCKSMFCLVSRQGLPSQELDDHGPFLARLAFAANAVR